MPDIGYLPRACLYPTAVLVLAKLRLEFPVIRAVALLTWSPDAKVSATVSPPVF